MDRADYLSFFYILSSWRLLRGDLASIKPKKKIRSVWKLFFETHRSEVESDRLLHWLFRKSRQIVTAYLHSVMRIGPSLLVERNDLVSGIFHGGAIIGYSSSVPQTDVSHHLAELESLHLRVFFTSPTANLCSVRDMRRTKRWWESRPGESVDERISRLFSQPEDWPEGKDRFVHFCRLYVPADSPREKWFREVQRWKGDPENDWKFGDFHISLAGRTGLQCDIYMNDSVIDMRALSLSARIMAAKCEGQSRADSAETETSIAVFGARILRKLMQKGGVVYIRPVASGADAGAGVGLATIAESRNACQHVAGEFSRACADGVRKKELDWFYESAGEAEDPSEEISVATLLFLGRLVVFDRFSGSEVTDIDVAWATFYNDRIVWTFCQLKEGRQTGGGSQLERIRPYITALGEVRRIGNGRTTKCWVASVCWKPPAMLPPNEHHRVESRTA